MSSASTEASHPGEAVHQGSLYCLVSWADVLELTRMNIHCTAEPIVGVIGTRAALRNWRKLQTQGWRPGSQDAIVLNDTLQKSHRELAIIKSKTRSSMATPPTPWWFENFHLAVLRASAQRCWRCDFPCGNGSSMASRHSGEKSQPSQFGSSGFFLLRLHFL